MLVSVGCFNFLLSSFCLLCEDSTSPLVKFKSVQTLLKITHIAHRKSYLVIICPNSHEKLTKNKIMSSSSQFKHCSESLI